MANNDPYSIGHAIGQMLAVSKGRDDKHSVGFARAGVRQPTPEQALMAAIEDRIFGTPFNNMGPPQRDPAVGRPMRMPPRYDVDYADPVRAIRQRYKADNAPDNESMNAAYDEAWRLEDMLPEDPANGGAPIGEKEAYAYFDRRPTAAPIINATAVMPTINRPAAASRSPVSSMSFSRSHGRGGSPYFEAGPSSQEGLDMASALLQQRLGAMGQNQNMDLMYRRDPRLALAIEEMRNRAASDDADRAQRYDIAGQEMDYRNRSLDMQGQMAGADRQASMERLLASLAARRGETTDQMSHAKALQEAAQIAATQEAARQREFLGSQQRGQQEFQGMLADKQMRHSTESESRRAMLETMLKGMEISGLDKRSQDDMRTKMLMAYANLAESASDPGYPAAKAELDKVFAGMNAQMSGATPAPQAAPTPKLVMDAVDPRLKSAWDAASTGKDGTTKKSPIDFLKSLHEQDVANNREALNAYLKSRYGTDVLPDRSYFSPWSSASETEDEIRGYIGDAPVGNFWNDAMSLSPLNVRGMVRSPAPGSLFKR